MSVAFEHLGMTRWPWGPEVKGFVGQHRKHVELFQKTFKSLDRDSHLQAHTAQVPGGLAGIPAAAPWRGGKAVPGQIQLQLEAL